MLHFFVSNLITRLDIFPLDSLKNSRHSLPRPICRKGSWTLRCSTYEARRSSNVVIKVFIVTGDMDHASFADSKFNICESPERQQGCLSKIGGRVNYTAPIEGEYVVVLRSIIHPVVVLLSTVIPVFNGQLKIV